MKAITQNRYGAADALSFSDVEPPKLGAGDVRIQVYASVVTQGDRRLRDGDFPGVTFVPGRLAMGVTGPRARVPGTSFAGQVVAVGDAVTRFAVGDDVFGSALHGAHAEQMALPEDGPLARMPAALTYEEAAALPYGGGTARHFLGTLAELQAGQRVCILGATGGVGRSAIQLAKHLGAEVTAVGSGKNEALARTLGADHFVDYRTDDYRSGSRRFDVVLDTVGASSFAACREVLTERGRYLSLIVSVRLLLQMAMTSVFGGRRAIAGVAMGGADGMDALRALIDAEAIRPVIDRVFAFDQIREAHAYLDSGAATGAIVIRILAAPPRAALAAA